jgi:hypothetical protein
MAGKQKDTSHEGIFGGLAGGIFFFGLALAFYSGHFWAGLFVTLALTSLVGSMASGKLEGVYGGFQGFIFLLGIGLLILTGWWWPGILILLGLASILGSLSVPLSGRKKWRRQPEQAPLRDAQFLEEQPLYRSYEEGYQEVPSTMTPQNDRDRPATTRVSYDQPQLEYPQEQLPSQQ